MKKSELTSPHPILAAENVCKQYATADKTLDVLKGINLEIRKGEMVMIYGRSGSGKSTLLHLLGGLDRPSSGAVKFHGRDISHLNDAQISEYRSKQVGFVFQFYHLLPELTLFENVILPGRIAGADREREAKRLLDRVGLSHRMSHYPSQLSGGEQQRAAIARSLANDPHIILCDEPTGNLDEETADSVLELLLALNEEEKKTFVIVTHEMSLVKNMESIYEIQDGVLKKARKK